MNNIVAGNMSKASVDTLAKQIEVFAQIVKENDGKIKQEEQSHL